MQAREGVHGRVMRFGIPGYEARLALVSAAAHKHRAYLELQAVDTAAAFGLKVGAGGSRSNASPITRAAAGRTLAPAQDGLCVARNHAGIRPNANDRAGVCWGELLVDRPWADLHFASGRIGKRKMGVEKKKTDGGSIRCACTHELKANCTADSGATALAAGG